MENCQTPPKIKNYGLEPKRVTPVVYVNDQIRPANAGDQLDPCFIAPPVIHWNPINSCSGILTINGASVVLDFCTTSPPPPPPPQTCNILASCNGIQYGFLADTSFAGANAVQYCNGTVLGYLSAGPKAGFDELRNCNGTLLGYINPSACDYSNITPPPPPPVSCDVLAHCNGSNLGFVSQNSFTGANLIEYCSGGSIGYIASYAFPGADELRTCNGSLIGYINPIACDYPASPYPPGCNEVMDCSGNFRSLLNSTGVHDVRNCEGTVIGYLDNDYRDCSGNIWVSGCDSGSPTPGCANPVWVGCATQQDYFCPSQTPVGGNELQYCNGSLVGHLHPSPVGGGQELRYCNGTLIGYSSV